ncbi:MAG: hypothetical protein U0790_00665 [Isosphaeraceae bacterium]
MPGRQAVRGVPGDPRNLAVDHPTFTGYRSDLGATLNNLALVDLDEELYAEARDRLREAVALQKKAMAEQPRNPTYRRFLAEHYVTLAVAARGLDDVDLAAEVESGQAELKASDPRLQSLDARLVAVRGGAAPTGIPEILELAQRAYDSKRFAAAAKLWAEALEGEPKLAKERRAQHPYNAACSAAMAADGQGIDPPVNVADRARHRGMALDWLRSEIVAWSEFIESSPRPTKAIVAGILQHWKEDGDLESVRDRIEKLSDSERPAWQSLWADVEELLKKAQAP